VKKSPSCDLAHTRKTVRPIISSIRETEFCAYETPTLDEMLAMVLKNGPYERVMATRGVAESVD